MLSETSQDTQGHTLHDSTSGRSLNSSTVHLMGAGNRAGEREECCLMGGKCQFCKASELQRSAGSTMAAVNESESLRKKLPYLSLGATYLPTAHSCCVGSRRSRR